MKYKIEFVDNKTPEEMARTLNQLAKDMPAIIRLIQARLAETVIRIAQEKYLNSGGGPRTLRSVSGTLSSSLRWWFAGSDVYVGTNLVYAAIHEYGGIIKAKNAPYLVFKIGDKWIRTKQVTMPARPYLSTSIKELFDTKQYDRIASLTLQQELSKRMVS